MIFYILLLVVLIHSIAEQNSFLHDIKNEIQLTELLVQIDQLPSPLQLHKLSSEFDDVCKPSGDGDSVLWMDVQWIIQGYSIGFSGFFVEFLGIAEYFSKLVPLGRLVKSSFSFSFDEIPVKDYERFFNHDLFPKEKAYIYWLIHKNYPSFDYHPSTTKPTSLFPSKEIKSNESYSCDVSHSQSLTENGVWNIDLEFNSTTDELSRSVLSNIISSEDCCHACLQEILCTQWTYYKTNQKCKLSGIPISSISSSLIPHSDTVTGKIAVSSPQSSSTPSASSVLHYRLSKPKALIFHGTTCIHRNSTSSFKRDPNTIFIGRYMVERSAFVKGLTIDEYAVSYCSGIMDEIWVPTAWHKDIFGRFLSQQGVSKPMIEIIPEAVDTSLFMPSYLRQPPSEISNDFSDVVEVSVSGGTVRDETFLTNHHTLKKQCHFEDIVSTASSSSHKSVVQCLQTQERFEFLSIFKWEYRKGWDVLLLSYWTAFSVEDNVVLRLRTYLPRSEHGDRNITRQMEQFAGNKLGKSLDELAPVIWETGNAAELDSEALSREQMRDLLESADAFVLPTRGEGWGLPIAEAMSMVLPVIITNATGITAYATNDNAYLVQIESMLDELSFVIPSKQSLTSLFRQVIEDFSLSSNYEAIRKGRNARQRMKEFSPESIICKMNERLRFHAKRRGWQF
jgi:glycosyltransferase involved in cell wall biosynthesis